MERLPREKKLNFATYLVQVPQLLNLSRAAIYVFFGGYLFFQEWFLQGYPIYKYAFCGLSVSYGMFRLYRVYADFKSE